MPKIIELTFELNINKVSCPGVWLCQDGLVSLTVFALGSNYQTTMLPPIFPLLYRDVFYFRKRFQASCTLSNIFCLLKDETVYCELIQWCGNCNGGKCTILAQYLGALNDVLFPPNLCSNEGVDLLMRRSKGFPGILAPKIEISTKVRIDEVYDQASALPASRAPRIKPCACRKPDASDPSRQKQVCHTPLYHRCRHGQKLRPHSAGSCCSGLASAPDYAVSCVPPPVVCVSRSRTSLSAKHKERCREYHQYQVFNVSTPKIEQQWQSATNCHSSTAGSEYDLDLRSGQDNQTKYAQTQKPQLESRFIEPEPCHQEPLVVTKTHTHTKRVPCVCDICRRYYQLFHAQDTVS